MGSTNVIEAKASEPKELEVGSNEPNVSACSAASMLDVVGVCAIMPGRTSKGLPKLSWPAIGDSVKNCCCIMGSTDAATEFVDSATLRRTFSAIQSLQADKFEHSLHDSDENYHSLQEQLENLECAERGVTANCL